MPLLLGAVLHLILSTIFGMAFGAVLGTARVWQLLGAGVLYGILLWIIGGMLLLPAGAGMPVLQMGMFAMQKLVGHLVFGIVTALILWRLRCRPPATDPHRKLLSKLGCAVLG